MKEITAIFRNSKDSGDQHQQEEITFFSNELQDFKLSDDSILQDTEKTVIYIAGYIAKCLAKEKCTDCNEMFSPGKVQLSISVESDETDPSAAHDAKLEFVEQISQYESGGTFFIGFIIEYLAKLNANYPDYLFQSTFQCCL